MARNIFRVHRITHAGLRRIALTMLLVPSLAITPCANAQDEDAPRTSAQAVADQAHASPGELTSEAWRMLTGAGNDKRSENRIQALAALATLPSPRAEQMIADALSDSDLDVRTAAILAAGQRHTPVLLGRLHGLLDDPEPQVVFSVAVTLWKLGDHAGEDILLAVAQGERAAHDTLVNGARRTARKDLHDPSALARMGALQGASFFLGPFGFGVSAYEMIRRNGGNLARAQAIDLLAEQHNVPIRTELLSALGDKDPSVRASAAKALGAYSEPDVPRALANLFIDPKTPVRLTAAASYLRTTTAPPTPRGTPAKPKHLQSPQ